MSRTSIYLPLGQFLQQQAEKGIPKVTITFEEVEMIIREPLPKSARKYDAWWGNCYAEKSRQCRYWLDYGWVKEEILREDEIVIFRRN